MSGTSWSDQAIQQHGRDPLPGPEPEPGEASTTPQGHGLPAPTVWPATLALGVTLIAASLPTSWLIGLGGAVFFALGLRGWVRDLLGDEEYSVEAPADVDASTPVGGSHG